MNAPGRPTMITFFPAQYSAISMFATSGNPCITVADGIFAGAAKASAPLIACIPTRAARDFLHELHGDRL